MSHVRTPPWRQLGTTIETASNSKEAIKLAGLDWRVSLYPLVANINGDKEHPVPDRFATVREDNHFVLGVVGSRYRVIQNSDAFLFRSLLCFRGEIGAVNQEIAVQVDSHRADDFTLGFFIGIQNSVGQEPPC